MHRDGTGRVALTDAGWSSSVARWAHNPEVAGSNPAPATTQGSKYKGSSATALGPLIICHAFVMRISEARPLRRGCGPPYGAPEIRIGQPCSASSLPANKRSQERRSDSGP